MSGRLSNSKTFKCSEAQGAKPSCRIPSSVINSQWLKLIDSSLGQQALKTLKVLSVISTHSSRSIFSRRLQLRANAENPVSVNCETAAHSSVLSFGQHRERARSDWSVKWLQLLTQRYAKSGQASASLTMPSSWTLRQP